MYDFSCSTVQGLLPCNLCFMMQQTLLMGDRSVLQVDSYCGAFGVGADCGSSLSCWNKQGRPWKRHCLLGSTLLQNHVPPTPSRMLTFELCADNDQNGPSPLLPGWRGVHDFQKEFLILTCQTTGQFSTSSQCILNVLWWTPPHLSDRLSLFLDPTMWLTCCQLTWLMWNVPPSFSKNTEISQFLHSVPTSLEMGSYNANDAYAF